MTDFTTALRMALPNFDISPWHDEVNNNFTIIDAAFLALTGLITQGVWVNNTAYTIGQNVVDAVDGRIWTVAVNHTSAAAPTTFAADRTANPTYWVLFTASVANRGQWVTATNYNVNDFVSDTHRFGVVVTQYTSGASYNADVAGGKIVTLIDMTPYVTLGIGQSISSATTKNPPSGGDLFGFADVADSNNLKKITYTQLLTAMTTEFVTETEANTNFYTKTQIDTNIYDTSEADARFLRQNEAVNIGTNIFTGNNSGIIERGYLVDCECQNDTGDLTNDIIFGVGECASAFAPYYKIVTPIAMSKRLDATWTLGPGGGGLDQGTIADASYHCHDIRRANTGVVDHIFSLSHDDNDITTMTIASPCVVTWTDHGLVPGAPIKFTTTGALPTGVVVGTQYFVQATGFTVNSFRISTSNGGADVNSSGTQSGVHTVQAGPVLPTNYTQFRRRFSISRAAGTIRRFYQNGDNVEWLTVIQTRNNVAALALSLLTFGVPYGIKVKPFIRDSILVAGSPSAVVVSLGSGNVGASPSVAINLANQDAAVGMAYDGTFPDNWTTNKQGQLWITIGVTATVSAHTTITQGYVDNRGKMVL